ncbi:MAG: hypothetical protein SF123_18160 [Chloroflexota bacterium]|nr:hypothetical protein [Chloroflexota bacterium]
MRLGDETGMRWGGMLVTALLLMALMLPLMPIAVIESADYRDHIRDARLWAEAGMSLQAANRPHFLFHALTISAHTLLMDWNAAGSTVIIVMAGVTGAIVYALLRPAIGTESRLRGDALAVIGALALMLIGPVTILTWAERNLYLGYIPAHVYHNPTQNVLKPFALLFFVCALRVYLSEQRDSPNIQAVGLSTLFAIDLRQRNMGFTALTFVIGLCATLAKPSFSICLLPALGAVTLYRLYRRQPVNWLLLIFGVGAPVALVLAWQYLFHRSGMGGFALDPFLVMDFLSPGTWHWKFIMSIMFPAAVTLAYWRQARSQLDLNVAWLAFGASTVYLYFLNEPRDFTSANFWWSAQICIFVLMVISTVFFVRQLRAQPRWTWQAVVCALLLTLHVASGVLWYVVQYDAAGFYAWW